MTTPTWAEIGGVVIFFLTITGALWAIWWRIEGRVEKAKEAAYYKSDEARSLADAAAAKANLAREELADYKTHVAETYISKAGHRETTDQLMGAINGVKSAIDGTNQRIDRLFDDRPPKN